jgi:hypothetical protein
MSELIKEHNARSSRWHLLATVSTLALSALFVSVDAFAADRDSDKPTVWIELGGQLERVDGGQDRFMPLFAADVVAGGFKSPAIAQTPPRYAVGGETKITISPDSSDWVFSAGLRYGRSNGRKHTHEQRTVKTGFTIIYPSPTPSGRTSKYATGTGQVASDSKTQEHESHVVLDVQAGKDVGLGLFGRGSTSVISAGVRYAEFTSSSTDNLIARPIYGFNPYPLPFFGFSLPSATRYDFHGIAENHRSFRGIGPSLSWESSSHLTGSEDDGGLTFDWGLNAAILFGRQKSTGHHQTTAYHYEQKYYGAQGPRYALAYPVKVADHTRSRSVVVPNIGGFIGASLRWSNAKVSLGYRGDFFFGAMDGGVDTHISKDRAFYGPFASIAVGL